MGFSSNLILSGKTFLISAGIVSIALFIKLSVPLLRDLASNEVPLMWFTLLSWLKPPYLYLIINAIIITIAASSRLHQKFDNHNQSVRATPQLPSDLPSNFSPAPSDFDTVSDSPTVCESEEAPVLEVKPVMVNGSVVARDEDEVESLTPMSTWTPPETVNYQKIKTEYRFLVTEKPLVSSRFDPRKPVKTTPEGDSALRVAKPKSHETLESTWKMITDGRHVPLTRHLRMSETLSENKGSHVEVGSLDYSSSPQNVKKAETFRDRTNYEVARSSPAASGGGGKLRKEPSLTQEEVNRRVEAFIKKFNEDMRLQRQESLDQYTEMVNRGAH